MAENLENDINELTRQHLALAARLPRLQKAGDLQGVLTLQSDLGELEKQLTLAKEIWTKAIS